MLPRQKPPGTRDQGVQQIEFGAREINLFLLAVDYPTPDGLDFEAGKSISVARLRGGCNFLVPPQHGADTRNQFPRVEWLSEIIVRSEFETYDAINILFPRSEENYRECRFLRAQVAANVQAGAVGQHHIQNRKGDRTRGDRLLETPQVWSE